MKVYVAGKYEDKKRCSEVMQLLRDEGDLITCDWTHHKYEDKQYPMRYCQDDMKGVEECEVFVGVFIDKLEYAGSLVEFGMALILRKQVVVVGHGIDHCIFTHHPSIINVENVGELLYIISTLAEDR